MMRYYVCDPAKNTKCSKTGCYYNKLSSYPACRLTRHAEYENTEMSEEEKRRILFAATNNSKGFFNPRSVKA